MPEKFPNQIFLFPIVAVFSLLIGIFLYAKFGPSIPISVHQITTNQDSLFTVTGEGKATAVPDIAQVNLGITVNGASVSQVQTQANSVIKNVTSAVKNLGVGDKDIQTTSYSLQPDYDFSSGRQTIKGFVININLQVKARDFSKINQIIDAGTQNGANQVGGLTFTLDDVDTVRAQARKLAIENAKKKATEMANEAGIRLGRIVNVFESQDNNFPGPQPLTAMAKSEGAVPLVPTQIEPGSSEITVAVTLSYETR